jgi:hypothetical protein
MSQRELQTDGVSYAYISRLESGDRVPSFQTLIALADGLGVTAEYLAFGRPLPHACPFCGRARRAPRTPSPPPGGGGGGRGRAADEPDSRGFYGPVDPSRVLDEYRFADGLAGFKRWLHAWRARWVAGEPVEVRVGDTHAVAIRPLNARAPRLIVAEQVELDV